MIGRRYVSPWVALALLSMAGGCLDQQPARTYADPTAGFSKKAVRDAGANDVSADVSADVVDDGAPPQFVITAPIDGAVVEGETAVVSGTATDPLGIAAVRVRVDNGAWLKAELGKTWKAWLTVPPGDHTISVEVSDFAGNTASKTISLHRIRVVQITALVPEKSAAPVVLDLDRAAVQALIPTAAAKELIVYMLDVRPLLVTALEAFKAPAVWGLDTKLWGPAEWNMHRILTMTPDSADLDGTSAAPLLALASNLGLAPALMLADIANVTPTTPFLSTQAVAQALFRSVLSSHPALVVDPIDGVKKVPISLHDAFVNLVSLDKKLGPAGDHPGILYKSTPAPVLLPNFGMTLTGRSNLRQLEGVDLSGGQRWLFVKAPGDDVVVFNFLDPKTFTVTGIADEPQIDLYFKIQEFNGFIDSAYSKGSGAEGSYFKGSSAAWKLPPWTFERMVIRAVFDAYKELHADAGYKLNKTYDIGAIKSAASWSWDKGWLDIKTIAGIGKPPPATYWWDLVLELAQRRMHDGGIPEGKADLRLPLTGIPVPLKASVLIDKARVLFEKQKSKLSAASVGDHATYDTPCDIFAVQNNKGDVALMFVTPTDLPGSKQAHPTPGFFADVALTKKISSTADAGFGDVIHEKLLLKDGENKTFFAKERSGSVWKVDVTRSGVRFKLRLWPTAMGAK